MLLLLLPGMDVARGKFRLLDLPNGRRTRMLSSLTSLLPPAPRFPESKVTGRNPSSTGWLPSKQLWQLELAVARKGKSRLLDLLNGRHTRTLSLLILPHQLVPRFQESRETGPSPNSTGWLPSKQLLLLELDVARGRQQQIGRPALSTRLAAGNQTTTVRTTGKRTSSVPPKAGKLPLLPATVVARGKPRPLLTLLPLPPDPPLSTLPSLPSTLLPLPLAQPLSTLPSLPSTLLPLPLGQLRSTMPSLALISLPLPLAPPQSTMLRPSSTSSRRRLTS